MPRTSIDSWASALLHLLAAPAVLMVVLIVVFLGAGAAAALVAVSPGQWLTDPGWHPTARAADGSFRMAPMVAGTLGATAGAMALAAPLGVLSAVFTRFYAPPALARSYRRLLALLAGIPSVVFGFWGLTTLVPLIRQLAPPGPSLLAGSIILALMVLPTVALLTDAALRAVPQAHLQAAAALGLSRRRTIWSVAVPAARAGLLGALLLGTARAIGETMAVLMVAGNVVQVPSSVFDPIRTLTANVALELGYALGDHRSTLFASGLVLVAMVAALLVAAQLATRGRAHG